MYSREEQTRATLNEALKTLCLAKQPLSPLPRRREAAARRKGADISLEIETEETHFEMLQDEQVAKERTSRLRLKLSDLEVQLARIQVAKERTSRLRLKQR